MPELEFFLIQNLSLSSLLMVAPSFSVDMERLKDGNVELSGLFAVISKFLNKRNKEIKVKRNFNKIPVSISSIMLRKLRLRQKNGFLISKKTCCWDSFYSESVCMF